jgi:hypothetical protein
MKILRTATSIGAAIAFAGLAACAHHNDSDGLPASASPSAVLIGTVPAEPTGDPPGTTPVAATSEISKPVEQAAMPLPGQPNDHSNLAANPSQKANSNQERTPQ